MSKSTRGLHHELADDKQVLVLSLFDGLGACRVALDVIGAKVSGYIAAERDSSARRALESNFGSTEFVEDVGDIPETFVKSLACKYSRTSIVLISGGPPCQGVSGLNAARLGAEADPRSSLHHEAPRVRELVQKHFRWCEILFSWKV